MYRLQPSITIYHEQKHEITDKSSEFKHQEDLGLAMIIVDVGVNIINLKHMGRWKIDSCVEGYLANSKFFKHKWSLTIGKELEAAGNHNKQAKIMDDGNVKSGVSTYPISTLVPQMAVIMPSLFNQNQTYPKLQPCLLAFLPSM